MSLHNKWTRVNSWKRKSYFFFPPDVKAFHPKTPDHQCLPLMCFGDTCARLVHLHVYVCVLPSACVFVYQTAAQSKPALCEWNKLRHRCCVFRNGKETQACPDVICRPHPRPRIGWINKTLFRIVFGEGDRAGPRGWS